MKAILRVNFKFLAQGTVLRKDHEGNYFVSIPDEDYLSSPIDNQKITVNGHYVEAHPEVFEIIEKEESRAALLQDAIQLLNGMAPSNDVAQEAIAKINRALRTKVD
jgi:hypothetical protein